MKLIELHILQSYPVSCLNRDDVGSPKTAYFGGVQRARVSSQCQKRATRLAAREIAPRFGGVRSRFLKEPFEKSLRAAGLEEGRVEGEAQKLCELFSKQDAKHKDQVTTAVYLSPAEIDQIANAVANDQDPKKVARKASRLDAADIALFGRMVANDATLNVEGASMFSHALSTHKSSNEIDFYSSVDDAKSETEDAGAGMIGTLEFTSAVYYRYAALNLDLLFDTAHLGKLDTNERKEVVDAFIRATLMAVPGARKNSMNAATLPFEVLAVYKDKGQPIQLVNAFEKPVMANGKGLAETSATKMKEEMDTLKRIWDIEAVEEMWLSESNLKEMISTLISHVE